MGGLRRLRALSGRWSAGREQLIEIQAAEGEIDAGLRWIARLDAQFAGRCAVAQCHGQVRQFDAGSRGGEIGGKGEGLGKARRQCVEARRFDEEGQIAELCRQFSFDHCCALVCRAIEAQDRRVTGDIDCAAKGNRPAPRHGIDRQVELGGQAGELGIAHGGKRPLEGAHDDGRVQALQLLLGAAGAVNHRAILDGEVVDGDFAAIAAAGGGTRPGGAGNGAWRCRRRGKLPIGVSIRQALQDHHGVDQGDAGDLDLAA